MISHRKYGPPQVRPKPYSIMLELLETQANKKLTSEYTTEITLAMSRLEPISQVNPSMIDLQPEIQWFMRPFLLDFLIELHSSFKLQPQTLFLCLNLIDRYCAKRIVFKRHYQLVGCTALWIAAKYEDKKSRVPTLKELTIMCRNAYDEEMFIQMEMHILSTLEWCLSHPNLEDCLQLAISHSNINPNTTPCKYNVVSMKDPSSKELAPANSSSLSAITVVGRFLCELSLYNTYFLSVPVSLVSITANLLACSMLQIPNASDTLRDLIKDVLYNKNSASMSPLQPHGFNDASSHDSDYTDIDLSDDEENKQPEVHGAFLSGLDENSINTIKKIALMFIIQFSKTTEVLTKKYEALGVIQVINNFHSRFTYIVASVCEQQEAIAQEEVLDPKLLQLSEILLQFPKVEPETHLHNHRRQSTSSSASSSACSSNAGSPHTTPIHPFHSASTLHLNHYENGLHPITPPSATSQYSVFSNKRSNSACATPVHSNANMSVSSASSSILRNNKSRITKGKVSNYSTSSYSTSNISLNHPNPNPNIAHQSGGLPPPPPPPHRLNSVANNSVTEFSPLNNNGAGTSESTAWSSPIMHV